MKIVFKRGASLIAASVAVLMVAAGPASASAGMLSTGGSNEAGRVEANCLFESYVPEPGDSQNLGVAFTTSARGFANSPLNPVVSTSVECELVHQFASGRAGLTLAGSAVASAGVGEMDRAVDPDLCVKGSAAFLFGQVVHTDEDNPGAFTCAPFSQIALVE